MHKMVSYPALFLKMITCCKNKKKPANWERTRRTGNCVEHPRCLVVRHIEQIKYSNRGNGVIILFWQRL
jgi:hypothetical protein